MPTAVELIANFLKKSLALNVGDGSVDEAFFNRLDSQFGPGFDALNHAITPRQFASVERQYGKVFETLGAGAMDIGFHLERNAVEGFVIGQALARADIFSGQGGGSGSGASGDGGGAGLPHDFGVFEAHLFKSGDDLVALGADLARLGRVSSHQALVAVEERFHADLQRAEDDFVQLGRDTRQLSADIWPGGGGGSGTGASGDGGGAGRPVEALASALNVLGSAFSHAGGHFGDLNADIFSGQGGGSGDVLNGGGLTGAMDDFVSLRHDFIAMDHAFQGLAAPIAGLLVPAVTPAPGVG